MESHLDAGYRHASMATKKHRAPRRKAAEVINPGVFVVADMRERAVVPFLESELQMPLLVEQITVGDYLICEASATGRRVLACIERKTWADLAASISDGRHRNVEKMEQIRTSTGCKLFLLLEGPAWPHCRFGHMTADALRAFVASMQVRHGLHVVQAADQAGSAARLHELAKAYERALGESPVAAGAADAGAADAGAAGAAAGAAGAAADAVAANGVPAAAMVRDDPDARPDLAVLTVWNNLSGIALVYSKIVSRAMSVADVVRGVVSDADIDALRSPTGTPLRNQARATLRALRGGERNTCCRALSGINGISATIADVLMTQYGSLRSILSLSEDTLSIAQVPHGKKTVKLGKKRAARILRILSYKDAPATTTPAVSAAAAASAAAASVASAAAADEGQNESELLAAFGFE